MASWTLGKIFAVDEEKEATQEPSVSGSDEEEDDEDEDVRERQAAFNKSKQKSAPVTGSNRSIRRYDEFGDYLTRSERARNDKVLQEQQQQGGPLLKGMLGARQSSKGGRRVSFVDGDAIEEVHEVDKLTDQEKEWCFMTRSNWQAIDTDIDITTKRWTNHMEGRIAFDEDNNTIRGIEDMIFKINKSKPIIKHRKSILEEVVRQKTNSEYPDWAKLSAISQSISAPQRKMAIELGKEDEEEKNRVWAPKPQIVKKESSSSSTDKSKDGKSKRKSSFFGLFKKK